ncbi:hypothetical protein PBI_SCTP2_87 [Salicola phage SCTP-2]|nr:hypothetical protein PBI_SCTP2_87 [Salicola phage SCTP-2]
MSMIDRYPETESQYQEDISYIVMFSNGSISYEEAWTLSGAEKKHVIESLKKKMEMNSMSMGGQF